MNTILEKLMWSIALPRFGQFLEEIIDEIKHADFQLLMFYPCLPEQGSKAKSKTGKENPRASSVIYL
jgi:hypothetical protein